MGMYLTYLCLQSVIPTFFKKYITNSFLFPDINEYHLHFVFQSRTAISKNYFLQRTV